MLNFCSFYYYNDIIINLLLLNDTSNNLLTSVCLRILNEIVNRGLYNEN